MGLDVGVLDDEVRYIKTLHIDQSLHETLFRKLVTTEEYPSLGKARKEAEDITFAPGDVPGLLADVTKLEGHIKSDIPMSAEVKGRCLDFLKNMKDICDIALKENRNVEFIAGE